MSDLPDSYYINPAVKNKGFVTLKCANHPELKWHTKNISPLGCRHIYSNQSRECDCPYTSLVLAD